MPINEINQVICWLRKTYLQNKKVKKTKCVNNNMPYKLKLNKMIVNIK